MADSLDKVVIKTNEAVDTLGKLRREMASLNAQLEDVEEGSEAFVKLQNELKKTEAEVSKVEGAFGDATDKIKTLSGSGVERFNASVGLMREGIRNLDLGKFKIGIQGATQAFGGLRNAIIATGIGALVLAVTAIITNFDKLKEAGGLVGKVFTAIGDVIKTLIKGITEFSNALGLTNINLDESSESMDKYAEAARGVNQSIEELAIRQRLLNGEISEGEAAREMAAQKRLNTELEAEQEAAEVRAKYSKIKFTDLTEDQKKELDATLNLLENKKRLAQLAFENDLKEIENREKEKADATIKAQNDQAKRIAESNARIKKQLEDKFSGENELERLNRAEKEQIAEAKRVGVSEEIILNIRKDFYQQRLKLADDNGEKLKSKEVKLASETGQKIGLTIQQTAIPSITMASVTIGEKITALVEEYADNFLEIASFVADSIGQISDISISKQETDLDIEEQRLQKQYETRKAYIEANIKDENQRNEALRSLNKEQQANEIRLEKQRIEIEKKKIKAERNATLVQLGLATATSIANAVKIASTSSFDPISFAINIAANIAAALTAIAKARQALKQADAAAANLGAGGGSDLNVSTGGGGSGGGSGQITPPTFNLGGQQIGGAGTLLGSGFGQNQQQPIKVFVSETDISAVQNKVQVTEGNSLFEGPQ